MQTLLAVCPARPWLTLVVCVPLPCVVAVIDQADFIAPPSFQYILRVRNTNIDGKRKVGGTPSWQLREPAAPSLGPAVPCVRTVRTRLLESVLCD